MKLHLRTILVSTVAASLLALALTTSPASAESSDVACTTTSQLRKSRPFPGSRHLKMIYCSEGSYVTVSLSGKGISEAMRVFTSVNVEFRMRDSKGAYVFQQSFDLGDMNGRFSSVMGVSYWETKEVLTFKLPVLAAGAYRLEGRLQVDWHGDGAGFKSTSYKRLPVAI